MDNNRISPPPTLSPALSPKISIVGISFYDALKELANGKKITRLAWENADYGFLKDGMVAIKKDGIEYAFWKINNGDLNGIDWIILTEN